MICLDYTTCLRYIEGSRPEWCISTVYHAWDTPFWSGTLHIILVQNPCVLVLPDMSGLLFVLILRLSDMHRAWMQIFLFFSLLIILFNLIWCICVCVLFLLTVNEVGYFYEQFFFQGSCSHGLLVMLLIFSFFRITISRQLFAIQSSLEIILLYVYVLLFLLLVCMHIQRFVKALSLLTKTVVSIWEFQDK